MGTHNRHYELYRKKILETMGFTDVSEDNQPVSFQQTFELKKSEHREELQRKEDEMRQTFVLRDKETELKEVEKELYTKYDQLKREHAEEKKRYEDTKKKIANQQLSSNTLTLGKHRKK